MWGNVSEGVGSYPEFKMPHPITYYLPELEDPERSFVAQLTGAMAAPEVQRFAIAYRQQRKILKRLC